MRLEVGVLLGGIEGGTGLEGIEVVVAEDEGTGEALLELAEEKEEGLALLGGAGVLGLTVLIEAAFVADADGGAVVVLTVGTDLVKGTTGQTGAVAADVVVVADIAEASALVVAAHLFGRVFLSGTRGGAVEDD